MKRSFFIGILEDFIPLKRKPVRAFGTQESNLSFPMEHCSFFMVSQESKTPLQSLVSDSFAEGQGPKVTTAIIHRKNGCLLLKTGG